MASIQKFCTTYWTSTLIRGSYVATNIDAFLWARYYAVVTPMRKAASYEPRIVILGIWGDTWLTRGKYGIYVAVRGGYGGLTGSTWRLLEILPRKICTFYCRHGRVSYVAVTRIPSLVLRSTWHYVIIWRRKFLFPKFVLRCSYEAALRKVVTTALKLIWPYNIFFFFFFFFFAVQIHGFLSLIFIFTNNPLILGIAFDRLLLVVFAHRCYPKRSRIYYMTVASWVSGILVASLTAGFGMFKYDTRTKHCSPDWDNIIYRYTFGLAYSAIPIPALIICYLAITYHLWKKEKRLRTNQQVGLSVAHASVCSMPEDVKENVDDLVRRITSLGFAQTLKSYVMPNIH